MTESKTKVDLPKIAQMLDAGWEVRVYKGDEIFSRSYIVSASHPNPKRFDRLRPALVAAYVKGGWPNEAAQQCVDSELAGSTLETDDFTPEQALTRMAYKVFGEII